MVPVPEPRVSRFVFYCLPRRVIASFAPQLKPNLAKFYYCLLVCLVVAASSKLNSLTDDGLGIGWTQNVLRNWEEYGFFQLHGQLMENVGGFDAISQPQIYAGHRPVGLYPAFFCLHYLGGQTGVSIYYALVAAMVLWSVWILLGRTKAAFWFAALVVLTPGYIRWQTTLDPNLAAALYGFPFCAIVVFLLQKPVWRWPQVLSLAILIFAYSSINWSTAFIFGMVFAFMLAMPGVSWRRLFIYCGIGALAGSAVVAVSVVNKMGPHESGGIMPMLAGYGWGNAGYGQGLSTHTAVLRLAFINIVGFLPIIGFLVWRSGRVTLSPRMLLGFLPLLMAMASVLGLRNYFAHHPWMSCHYLLLGLLLSAVVLKARLPARPAFPRFWGWAWLTGTLGYAFCVLAFFHVHNGREIELIHFVRDHTPRSATILVVSETDPKLAGLMDRLEFDRRHLVVANSSELTVSGTNAYVLTANHPPAGKLAVEWDGRMTGDSWMKRILAWFDRVIAHRRPGDKIEVGAEYYYLYQP